MGFAKRSIIHNRFSMATMFDVVVTSALHVLLLIASTSPAAVEAFSANTAVRIESFSCSRNAVAIFEASCGWLESDEPCILGDKIDFSGYYTAKTAIPTEVEICAQVLKGGKSLQPVCNNVDICEFMKW